MKVKGKKEKGVLTESPFIQHFDYGENLDGYWCYGHIILQLEDVVDVLNVKYGDRYEFVFYFDHSSGHDRLRPDGLNVNEMNKGFGGMQNNNMRNTKIEDESHLGEYSPSLRVGDIQHMQFTEGDEGPFWMPDQKKRG